MLNLGGPSSLFEVESFLKNIFCDPLILGIKSQFIRKMVANMIVHKRLAITKRNYEQIGGKSPIVEHTLELTNLLNTLDKKRLYTYAMRYTAPFAYNVLNLLAKDNVSHITLFSLYPQFSYSTIYSSLLDAYKALATLQNECGYAPKVREIHAYPTNEDYINCIVTRIKQTLGSDNPQEFVLLFSAHSLPKSRIDAGDPYKKECERNINAVRIALEKQSIIFKNIDVAYQSKATPTKWLRPSTIEGIKKYRKSKMILFPLSFSIDNSETEFELKILYKRLSNELNVPEYRVCKCFNGDNDFAQTIINILESSQNYQMQGVSYDKYCSK